MRRLILVLVFLVVVLGATTFYFYKNSKLSEINQKPGDQNEVKMLTEQVGKLIFLPQDEVPTIATVTSLDSLKGQPFFVDAKEGDKVLIFNKAKKAILYDPVANKIVNVAPVNAGSSGDVSTESSADASAEPPVKP